MPKHTGLREGAGQGGPGGRGGRGEDGNPKQTRADLSVSTSMCPSSQQEAAETWEAVVTHPSSSSSSFFLFLLLLLSMKMKMKKES